MMGKRRKSGFLRMRKGRKKVSSFWLETGRFLSFLTAFLSMIYIYSPAILGSFTLAQIVGGPLLFIALLTILAYTMIFIDYVIY